MAVADSDDPSVVSVEPVRYVDLDDAEVTRPIVSDGVRFSFDVEADFPELVLDLHE